MECATSARRVAGVTFVTCRLSSEAPREVRVRNELDGPVWPPRRRGVPERGWDEDGATVTVDGAVGVGYACPAPPAEPPATVVTVQETGDENEPGIERDRAPTADAAVRALGDPAPPRDAVPRRGSHPADGVGAGGGRASGSDAGRECEPGPGAERAPGSDAGRKQGPDAVEDWLAAVERRVELLESLATAESLPEATVALDAVGGLEDAARLAEAVERDREALAALGARAEQLRQRGAADPDLATLRRLA